MTTWAWPPLAVLAARVPAAQEQPGGSARPAASRQAGRRSPEQKSPPSVRGRPRASACSRESGDYRLQLRGYVQLRRPLLLGRRAARSRSTPSSLRRVRPIFAGHGRAGTSTSSIMPDFGGGTTVLQDACLDFKLSPKLRVRVGQVQVARSASSACSRPTAIDVRRARLPDGPRAQPRRGRHAPRRPRGRRRDATRPALFDGAPDGGSVDLDLNDGKDVGGRAVPVALQAGQVRPQGPGLRHRRHHRQAVGAAARLSLGRPGQPHHASLTGITADGTRTRYSPQLSFYSGPLRPARASTRSRESWVKKARRARARASSGEAWQATATFALTGDKASYARRAAARALRPVEGPVGRPRARRARQRPRARAGGVRRGARRPDEVGAEGLRLGASASTGRSTATSSRSSTSSARPSPAGPPAGRPRAENAIFIRTQVAF